MLSLFSRARKEPLTASGTFVLRSNLASGLGGNRTHVTAIFDGSNGLGIKRFLVRDPAGQEDMDHRVSLGRDRRVTLEIRPGLEPHHVSQSQSPQSDRSNRKKTSAIH